MTDPVVDRLAAATLLVPFPGDAPPRWVLDALEAGVSGVVLFAINGNVVDPAQLAALTGRLSGAADALVAIDEEGGDVTRLAYATGSAYPGNAALGAVDDTDLTRGVYAALGRELAEVGVNLDFAPSVDVNTASDNPVIGTRAFGSDPELVSRHAAAAIAGLQGTGVAAAAKHFPGHGATSADSHLQLPTVEADLDLLARRELAPFRAAVAAGVRAVMTGHVRVPALTGELPATMSADAVGGLLRDTMGFTGVVVSDAMDMRGASERLGIAEACVRALVAGVDLLCLGAREFADSVGRIRAAIVAAVADATLPVERLEESAERVGRLRAWLAAAPAPTPVAAADREIGLRAARRAVRGYGRLSALRAPLVVEFQAPPNIAVGEVPWGVGGWLGDPDLGAETLRVTGEQADPAAILDRATGRSLVVVVRDAHRAPAVRRVVTALLATRPESTVVEMGLPVWRPEAGGYVATYGAARVNGQAAAELLRAQSGVDSLT